MISEQLRADKIKQKNFSEQQFVFPCLSLYLVFDVLQFTVSSYVHNIARNKELSQQYVFLYSSLACFHIILLNLRLLTL